MRISTMPLHLRRLMLGTSALTGFVALASTAQAGQPALPSGGTVTAGSAVIAQPSANQLAVTTGTSRTVIDWQSFSIAAGNKVTIQQPGSGSITVNEVTGADPSQIFGDLSSNGRVVLANPNGLWFGPDSHVDVAGLVASTATLSDAARQTFASGGRLSLDRAGSATASIVNDGRITIASQGLAALVAPGVRNNGVIEATLGSVTLASGATSTLDFYGDGLVALAVTNPVTALAIGPDGKPFKATIENNGKIAAGHVLVTADVVKGVVDSVINMSGVTEAKGVTVSGGDIVLDGGDGAVTVAGTLDATSAKALGGTVRVTGGAVTLAATAVVDASGGAGGGTVQIGGGPHGGGTLRHAKTTQVAAGAQIKADATIQGNGGMVTLWSDQATGFDGSISARGAGTGNGGWVETSGHTLQVGGSARVDASAPNGVQGTWLLDPYALDVVSGTSGSDSGSSSDSGSEISSKTTGSTVLAGTINADLAYESVVLQTGGTGGGAITVDAGAAIAWSGSEQLTLDATANGGTGGIVVNGSITGTSGTLTLKSIGSITQGTGASAAIQVGNLELLGTGGSYTLTNANNSIGTLAANTGSVSLANGGNPLTIGLAGDTLGLTLSGSLALAGLSGPLTLDDSVSVTGGGVDFRTATTGASNLLLGATSTIGAGGAIQLPAIDASVAGEQGLTLTATGNAITLGGAVGGTTALASLTATGSTISAGSVTTTGAQSYSGTTTLQGYYLTTNGSFGVTGAATLGAATGISAGTGAVTFSGTIDGDQILIVNGGAIAFDGAIGQTANLASLLVTGSSIALPSAVATGLNNQSYSGPVTLTGGGATLTGGAISFSSTIDGASAGAQSLAITATGAVTFDGAIGTTGDGGSTALGSLTVSGTTITLPGTVATTGSQTYGGGATIVQGTQTTLSSQGGNLTFEGTLDGAAGGENLSAFVGQQSGTAQTGTITVDGAWGGTHALGTVSLNTGFGGAITVTANGSIKALNTVSLLMDTSDISSTGATITVGGLIQSAHGIVIKAADANQNQGGTIEIQGSGSLNDSDTSATANTNNASVLLYAGTDAAGSGTAGRILLDAGAALFAQSGNIALVADHLVIGDASANITTSASLIVSPGATMGALADRDGNSILSGEGTPGGVSEPTVTIGTDTGTSGYSLSPTALTALAGQSGSVPNLQIGLPGTDAATVIGAVSGTLTLPVNMAVYGGDVTVTNAVSTSKGLTISASDSAQVEASVTLANGAALSLFGQNLVSVTAPITATASGSAVTLIGANQVTVSSAIDLPDSQSSFTAEIGGGGGFTLNATGHITAGGTVGIFADSGYHSEDGDITDGITITIGGNITANGIYLKAADQAYVPLDTAGLIEIQGTATLSNTETNAATAENDSGVIPADLILYAGIGGTIHLDSGMAIQAASGNIALIADRLQIDDSVASLSTPGAVILAPASTRGSITGGTSYNDFTAGGYTGSNILLQGNVSFPEEASESSINLDGTLEQSIAATFGTSFAVPQHIVTALSGPSVGQLMIGLDGTQAAATVANITLPVTTTVIGQGEQVSGTILATHDLTLSAGSGIDSSATITAGGTLTFIANQAITASGALTAGNVVMTTGASITIGANVTTTGAFQAGIGAGASFTQASDTTISGGTGVMVYDNTTSSGSTISIGGTIAAPEILLLASDHQTGDGGSILIGSGAYLHNTIASADTAADKADTILYAGPGGSISIDTGSTISGGAGNVAFIADTLNLTSSGTPSSVSTVSTSGRIIFSPGSTDGELIAGMAVPDPFATAASGTLLDLAIPGGGTAPQPLAIGTIDQALINFFSGSGGSPTQQLQIGLYGNTARIGIGGTLAFPAAVTFYGGTIDVAANASLSNSGSQSSMTFVTTESSTGVAGGLTFEAGSQITSVGAFTAESSCVTGSCSGLSPVTSFAGTITAPQINFTSAADADGGLTGDTVAIASTAILTANGGSTLGGIVLQTGRGGSLAIAGGAQLIAQDAGLSLFTDALTFSGTPTIQAGSVLLGTGTTNFVTPETAVPTITLGGAATDAATGLYVSAADFTTLTTALTNGGIQTLAIGDMSKIDGTSTASVSVSISGSISAPQTDLTFYADGIGGTGTLTGRNVTIATGGGFDLGASLALAGRFDATGGGALVLTADTTISTSAGDIDIDATINGAHALTLTSTDGSLVLDHAVGASTALTSLTATAGDGITLNTAVTTSANQTYNGRVILATDTSLTAGSIHFTGMIDGAESLTLTATNGAVSLAGAVGGNTALTGLTITAGTISLGSVTTSGAQSYSGATSLDGLYSASSFSTSGAAQLGGATTVDASGGNIGFGGTIGGAQSLVLTATNGAVSVAGLVGGTAALTSLTIDAGTISLGSVTTSGAQSYTGTTSLDGLYSASSFSTTGAAQLGGATTVDASGGNIGFGGTIDGAQSLTLTDSNGAVSLAGAVGGNTALAGLTITAGTISLGSVTTSGAQSYTGATSLDGLYSASSFSTSGAALLGGATTVDASGGNISFGGTLDGGQTLVLTDTNGAVSLAGAVGGNTALAGLTITAGTISLGNVATTGAQRYTGTTTFNGSYTGSGFTANGAALLGGATTVGASGGNIGFGGTIDGAQSLVLTDSSGAVSLAGAVGGNTALAGLTITAGTISLGNVATTGAQTYTGTTTFDGTYAGSGFTANGADLLAGATGVTASGGAIGFGGTLDGAQRLVLTDANGTVSFGGAVGGTTALGSLTVTANGIVAGSVTTSGAQSYVGAMTAGGIYTANGFTTAGPVVLLANTTINGGTGAITLGAVNGLFNLVLTSADANIFFNGTIGAATARLPLLSIAGADNVTVGVDPTTGNTYSLFVDNFTATHVAGLISVGNHSLESDDSVNISAGSLEGHATAADLTVVTTGGISGNFVATGTSQISAGGDFSGSLQTRSGSISAGGSINATVTSTTDISLSATNISGSVVSGGLAQISATQGVSADVTAGSVAIQAGGNVSGAIVAQNGGAVDVTAGGSITGSVTGGHVNLTAPTVNETIDAQSATVASANQTLTGSVGGVDAGALGAPSNVTQEVLGATQQVASNIITDTSAAATDDDTAGDEPADGTTDDRKKKNKDKGPVYDFANQYIDNLISNKH